MRVLIAVFAACALFGSSLCVAADASVTKTAVTENGLVANVYVPASHGKRLPALLALGGSEGGLGEGMAIDAEAIAAHGYVVLHLGYFGLPGLPQALEGVPLEYFKSALDWLQAQPFVDAERVGIVGGSKGGEAALLVAARYPQIKVVVAAVPSSVVWPGIRGPGSSGSKRGSSWTLAGQDIPPLPYGLEGGFTSVYSLYEKGLRHLDQHPQARIPVERIGGPILLMCGRDDALWPSCPMSDQVVARLNEQHFKHRVELLAYPNAGHAAYGIPVPADSERFATLGELGGTPEGNNAARRDGWPRQLAFLDAALKGKQ